MRVARNAEYLDMIDRSMEQIKQGKVVIKTMKELEEMTNEQSYIFLQEIR